MDTPHFTDHAFRLLLDALMVNDPAPQGQMGDDLVLLSLVERESERRGFDNWVVAYHDFKPTEDTK